MDEDKLLRSSIKRDGDEHARKMEKMDANLRAFDRSQSPKIKKKMADMAKDRGISICQSQSMKLWVEGPNYKNLTSMHLYSWKAGLKTGMYYLRRKPKHQAQQFTIKPNKEKEQNEENAECLMCGS